MAKRNFEYKGRKISIEETGNTATIKVGSKSYSAKIASDTDSQWQSSKLYNTFSSPDELAKELVNYHYLA